MNTWANREAAGRALAPKLSETITTENAFIIGLGAGGTMVGHAIAQTIKAPLDIILTKPLYAPNDKTKLIGAIAPNNVRIIDRERVNELGIANDDLEKIAGQALMDMMRRLNRYRGDRPMPALANRPVILTVDALIHDLTAWAAVRALKRLHPQSITLATPIADTLALEAIGTDITANVCIETVDQNINPEEVYPDSKSVHDQDVMDVLRQNSEMAHR